MSSKKAFSGREPKLEDRDNLKDVLHLPVKDMTFG